ncbi:CCAAT/enhancer-binding protein zeta-like [Penaeus monodon]|uniref:CCAAT/enhancer-binding protein zeta-like n=1 Tax=Penaeus monodon TaxID=6687 RepID=UPI0018A76C89|nr:CCAAT/enhancer-binding protein zeta-like [Penaeus monodon]
MVKDLSTMATMNTQTKRGPFPFIKHGKIKKKEKHGKKVMKMEKTLREEISNAGTMKQFADNANKVVKGSKNGEKKVKKSKNKFRKLQDNEISSTTPNTNEGPSNVASERSSQNQDEQPRNFQSLWERYKPRTTPLIGAGTDWHTQLIKENDKEGKLDVETKRKLKDLAAKILENDIAIYNQNEERGSKRQEVKFRKTILSHGTTRDKLAAHVLRCMEAPVHSLNHLTALISMVTPKARGGYEEAFNSLTDLFNSAYLPKSRVARKFENHNFSVLQPFLGANREQAERQLALWYFEDQLALAYEKLVRHLKQISHDMVDKNKMKGIKSLITLLGNNPNMETDLILESVVNKLGDPSKKVASQSMYIIRTLLQRRPFLKAKVVMYVEIVLYRPNIAAKAQYYCLCFLKDIIFGKDVQSQELAKKLLKLYFGFFKACTKKGEVDTRLMSALLRGIKRAYPFSGMEGNDLDEQLETLFKICHLVNFNIAAQALQLIYQVLSSKNYVPDRFYNVLYRKLQDKSFGQSSANSAFLNLIFKAIVRDESLNRIKGFIKRLLQMSSYQTSNVACGILYLISEVMKEKPELCIKDQPLYQKALDEDDDDDGEVYEDVEDEDDDSAVEEKHKIIKEEEDIGNLGNQEMKGQKFNKENSGNLAAPPTQTNPNQAGVKSSWVHLPTKGKDVKGTYRTSYDPTHRNPMYCGSEFSPVWELHTLKKHFHPTVLLFANRILANESLNYAGDPLQDFTQMRFLNKFVFRNPKKLENQKDTAGGYVFGSRMQYIPQGARGLSVTDEEYLELDPNSVPEEEHFIYKYMKEFKVKKYKAKGEEEGDDEVNDDEFEEFLSKMGRPPKDDEEEISEELDFAGCATGNLDDEDNEFNSEDEFLNEKDDGMDEMDSGEENDEDMSELSGDDDMSNEDDDLDDEELIKTLEKEDDELEDMDDDELEFDEEDVAFSDEDDIGSAKPMKKKKEKGKRTKKSSKNDMEDLSSMFADAEDFAHLLEDNDEEEYGITSQAVLNRDRSRAKQLQWEKKRNHMDEGFDRWQNKRGKHPGARGRGPF